MEYYIIAPQKEKEHFTTKFLECLAHFIHADIHKFYEMLGKDQLIYLDQRRIPECTREKYENEAMLVIRSTDCAICLASNESFEDSYCKFELEYAKVLGLNIIYADKTLISNYLKECTYYG